MDPVTTEPRQLPSPACPECWQGHGEPYAVQFGQGMRTVSLHCPTCGHSWQVCERDRALPLEHVEL